MRSFDSGLAASAQDDRRGRSTPPTGDIAGGKSTPRSITVATWVARICFAFVFVVNVQCALGFALTPEAYMGAYELAGVPGRVGVQGIGIAFLMWNCTYPAFIVAPRRFTALGFVILAQQLVGLIGESLIRATLPAGHSLLASSIDRFIAFDGTGLVLMAASFAVFCLLRRRSNALD